MKTIRHILSGLSIIFYIFLGFGSDDSTSSTDETKDNSTREKKSTCCCHCYGLGKRLNEITGEYGICNSCDGTGKDIYNVTGRCNCN